MTSSQSAGMQAPLYTLTAPEGELSTELASRRAKSASRSSVRTRCGIVGARHIYLLVVQVQDFVSDQRVHPKYSLSLFIFRW